jgi:hypothetical protein
VGVAEMSVGPAAARLGGVFAIACIVLGPRGMLGVVEAAAGARKGLRPVTRLGERCFVTSPVVGPRISAACARARLRAAGDGRRAVPRAVVKPIAWDGTGAAANAGGAGEGWALGLSENRNGEAGDIAPCGAGDDGGSLSGVCCLLSLGATAGAVAAGGGAVVVATDGIEVRGDATGAIGAGAVAGTGSGAMSVVGKGRGSRSSTRRGPGSRGGGESSRNVTRAGRGLH